MYGRQEHTHTIYTIYLTKHVIYRQETYSLCNMHICNSGVFITQDNTKFLTNMMPIAH